MGETTTRRFDQGTRGRKIQRLLAEELALGAADDSFPLKPQRLVADTRAALGPSDIVLADTGAVKMWMARLYPTYEPNTCLISNGLSTMAFALPGAIGAKLARPESKVLAAVGDGAFLMNSQEIETALREQIPFVVLIWEGRRLRPHRVEDGSRTRSPRGGRIFQPRFRELRRELRRPGYRVGAAGDLLPMLKEALAADTVSVITCPVDYTENLRLTAALGELSGPF